MKRHLFILALITFPSLFALDCGARRKMPPGYEKGFVTVASMTDSENAILGSLNLP